MKSVAINEHGGVDKLTFQDVPEPSVFKDEVLVKVKACGVNHLDIWVREGLPGIKIPFPHILGCEVSGEVYKVGEGIKDVNIGDKVLIAPGISCGRCYQCLSGNDNMCISYDIMGLRCNGGYAEFAKAPLMNIIPLPEGLDFDGAAAIPLVFLTAWHMLITKARLLAGEDVLILGAGSGIGTAAVQIARLSGARVIVAAGTDEKLEKAKKLGADETINYKKSDFEREVKKLTNSKGVEVVFEHIGPDTWDKSIRSLSKRGRLVICGATSGPKVEIDLRYFFTRQLSIFGSYMGTKAELLDLLKLFGEKKLQPVIDRKFPLKEAKDAHQYMMDRKQFGKLVLNP
ncbi:MAG: zinc-binding dehydrogenase [Candidatus Omnitrophica bacterium]|nr:zinc-binding dehydrogenase [Candidatus Omnitrophota bacterium]